MLIALLLAQCCYSDGGVTDVRGPYGTVAGSSETISSGYLLTVYNGPTAKLTLDNAGQLSANYLGASVAVLASSFWAINSAGFYFASARGSGDGSADLMLVTEDDRAGPMVEGRAGGYPGVVTWRLNSDGSIKAGRQGARGTFVDSSGVGDPQGNSGPAALNCEYGSGANCVLLLAAQVANNSFHGAVTIANFEYRDAGVGLMFQVVSRGGRSEAPYAEGGGQRTIYTINDRGDQKLWGGTINPYFASELPTCWDGADDGRSGPHPGAIAFNAANNALVVCDDYGHWRTLQMVPLDAGE